MPHNWTHTVKVGLINDESIKHKDGYLDIRAKLLNQLIK